MSTVGRIVTYARSQSVIHVPGAGQLDTTLTIGGKGGITEMKVAPEGLLVTMKGLEVLVPFANITHMILAKAVPATPKAK